MAEKEKAEPTRHGRTRQEGVDTSNVPRFSRWVESQVKEFKQWLPELGFKCTGPTAWPGGARLTLSACPFDPEHTVGQRLADARPSHPAFITFLDEDADAGGDYHANCEDPQCHGFACPWSHFAEALEGEYQPRPQAPAPAPAPAPAKCRQDKPGKNGAQLSEVSDNGKAAQRAAKITGRQAPDRDHDTDHQNNSDHRHHHDRKTGIDPEQVDDHRVADKDQHQDAERHRDSDRRQAPDRDQHRDHKIDQADPWPAAMAPEAFHGVAGELVRLIEPHSEADPAALLVQFLAGFGNLIGKAAHFRVEGDIHSAKSFITLVGTTSKGRKGTSWGQVRRVLKLVDPDWVGFRVLSGLSSGEGLIWSVRDPIFKREPIREKRKIVGYQDVEIDAGVTDKRLLVIESELGSVLRTMRRESNTLSPIIRDAWDRDRLATLTKNSPARATGCHISLIGHITRDELRRYLTETEHANGFCNRFLWICSKRSKCLPEGGRLHENDLAPIAQRLKDAATFASQAGELRRDREASAIWSAIYPDLSSGRAGLLGAVTSRAEAQVMRVALIYALLDSSPAIRAEHLNAALAVWEYAEQSARHIFGSALGEPVADEIMRALRAAPGGLTRTQIRDHFGRNLSADQVGRALEVLVDAGQARSTKEAGDAGRPAERWFCT